MTKKKYVPHAWETVNCPFCNSNRYKLHEKFGTELQYSYVKCLDCGLIYSSPRPKYDEIFLKDAYEEYFVFDSDYSYSEDILDGWEKEIKDILKFDKKRNAILDIGSCMGDFLKVAKNYFNYCEGVEVAQNMAEFTNQKLNIKIHIGAFSEIHFTKKYSCIHMSHVIEHIPNPQDWIRKAKLVLEDDGILVMSVPNMNSLNRQLKLVMKKIGLRKGKWSDNTRTPDHLFEPTIESTLRFFNENGFKVLNYYTYSRKDMDASSLFGKIYNRKLKLGTNLRFFVTPS